MHNPIKANDRCEVVDGLLGKNSPNLGLIVRVKSYVGDHSQLGRIWRCEAEYAILGQEGKNVPTGQADFAQSWLKKIEPPEDKIAANDEIMDQANA